MTLAFRAHADAESRQTYSTMIPLLPVPITITRHGVGHRSNLSTIVSASRNQTLRHRCYLLRRGTQCPLHHGVPDVQDCYHCRDPTRLDRKCASERARVFGAAAAQG